MRSRVHLRQSCAVIHTFAGEPNIFALAFAPFPALCQGRRPAHGKSLGAALHRLGNRNEKNRTNGQTLAAQRLCPLPPLALAGRSQSENERKMSAGGAMTGMPAHKSFWFSQGRGIEILVLITDQFQNCVRESLGKRKGRCMNDMPTRAERLVRVVP